MLSWVIPCSILSLATMVAIDLAIGTRAEFLNAWSVIERLFGRTPEADNSMIAQRFREAGELLIAAVVRLLR